MTRERIEYVLSVISERLDQMEAAGPPVEPLPFELSPYDAAVALAFGEEGIQILQRFGGYQGRAQEEIEATATRFGVSGGWVERVAAWIEHERPCEHGLAPLDCEPCFDWEPCDQWQCMAPAAIIDDDGYRLCAGCALALGEDQLRRLVQVTALGLVEGSE